MSRSSSRIHPLHLFFGGGDVSVMERTIRCGQLDLRDAQLLYITHNRVNFVSGGSLCKFHFHWHSELFTQTFGIFLCQVFR